ncbi:MAG: hypothetical protein PG977_001285 [Bartonella clarridgeiae]|nr:MAG: hypothetical protein PG977_001285 [Bartonella clarridgeiae]
MKFFLILEDLSFTHKHLTNPIKAHTIAFPQLHTAEGMQP